MPSVPRPAVRLATGLLAGTLVLAGCGGGAAAVASPAPSVVAPTPTPTPTPTPRPTPTSTPRPTPAPSPSQAPSFITSLKIGSPYELVDNPANQALHGSFNFTLGSISATETLTGREIRQRTALVGLALVLEIVGIPMNEAAFVGGARGAAANSGGKLTYSTILGHRVAFIEAKTGAFGMYLTHDAIVMVGADKAATMKTLLTSVIKANS